MADEDAVEDEVVVVVDHKSHDLSKENMRNQKGGLTVSGVLGTITNIKMDVKEILLHIILFISYVLCFVYLYKPTTEMIAIFIFIALHLVFLFFVFSYRHGVPAFSLLEWDVTQIFNISYIDYTLLIIGVGWVLIAIALTWMIQVYLHLYKVFVPKDLNITFGCMEDNKESLFRMLIISTVMMWVFYILESIKTAIPGFFNKNLVINSFVLVFALLFMMYCTYSFMLARTIKNTLHTSIDTQEHKKA